MRTIEILEDGKVIDRRTVADFVAHDGKRHANIGEALRLHVSEILNRFEMPKYHVIEAICGNDSMKFGFGKTSEGYWERIVL